MPNDNVAHESVKACSVPVGLLRLVLRDCQSQVGQYGFQQNSALGGCHLQRFVTSPAKIETILFEAQGSPLAIPQRFASSFWNLDLSLVPQLTSGVYSTIEIP